MEPPSPVHEKIIPMAVELVNRHLQPGSQILDVGCGMALTAARLFKEAGHSVTCLSIIPEEVESATNQGFEAHQQDMHDLSAYREKHLVWLRHIAEHSPCPLLLFREAYDATSDIGLLYLEVPDPWTSCVHEANPNHYSVLTRLGWCRLLDTAGWKGVIEGEYTPLTGEGPDSYSYYLCVKK